MYKIDRNIPIPSKVSKSKYPLGLMQVGHSFFVPLTDSTAQCLTGLSKRMSVIGIQWAGTKCNGFKFSVRQDKINNGVRVWRVK